MLASTERDYDNLEKHNYGAALSGTSFRYIVTNV